MGGAPGLVAPQTLRGLLSSDGAPAPAAVTAVPVAKPKAQEQPRPVPAFRSSFVFGRRLPGEGAILGAGAPYSAPTGDAFESQFSGAPVQLSQPLDVLDPRSATAGLPVPGEILAPSRDQAARQRIEDALDNFLSQLPAWRGGQRDAGRCLGGNEEDHQDERFGMQISKASRSRTGSPKRHRKQPQRSSSRGRPSPAPVSRKGTRADETSGQKTLAASGKEKKEKRRERGRDRSSSHVARGKRRKDREDSRSLSRPVRKKPKDAREADRGSSSPSPAAKKKKKHLGEKDKERKDKEKEKDKGQPDWVPRSPEPTRTEPTRTEANGSGPGPTPAPAPTPVTSSAVAIPAQTPAVSAKPEAGSEVPDWLRDLIPAGRPQQPRREVMVPQQFVARLIGRGGEVIMGICNQTGADVKIRQETKDLGYSLAVITGPAEAMENAERLVLQKLTAQGVPSTVP